MVLPEEEEEAEEEEDEMVGCKRGSNYCPWLSAGAVRCDCVWFEGRGC